MKDEGKNHGRVNKTSSEQMAITFVVWKNWTHSTSSTRLHVWQAGKLIDKIVLNLEIFKITIE